MSAPCRYVRNPDIVCRWTRELHDTYGLSDRSIAEKPYFSSIPAGTINTIRKHNRIPKKWYLKLKIKCSKCGKLHHKNTYDCATEKAVPLEARVTMPNKTPRSRSQRAPSIEIALSDPDRARARLEQALKELE